MTVNEAINGEIRRLVNLLPNVDPISQTDTYDKIVDNLTSLVYLSYHGEDTGVAQAPPDEEPYIEPTPFPEPSAEEYSAPVMADKTYSMEEVRAALGNLRSKKGIEINPILEKFGVSNFSALPAGRYPELMAYLETL